jgi:hypothetical protein
VRPQSLLPSINRLHAKVIHTTVKLPTLFPSSTASSLAPARRVQQSHGVGRRNDFSVFVLVHRPTLKIHSQEIIAPKNMK